jgi:uncharacterized protein YbcV (DUF1398 family)
VKILESLSTKRAKKTPVITENNGQWFYVDYNYHQTVHYVAWSVSFHMLQTQTNGFLHPKLDQNF